MNGNLREFYSVLVCGVFGVVDFGLAPVEEEEVVFSDPRPVQSRTMWDRRVERRQQQAQGAKL